MSKKSIKFIMKNPSGSRTEFLYQLAQIYLKARRKEKFLLDTNQKENISQYTQKAGAQQISTHQGEAQSIKANQAGYATQAQNPNPAGPATQAQNPNPAGPVTQPQNLNPTGLAPQNIPIPQPRRDTP